VDWSGVIFIGSALGLLGANSANTQPLSDPISTEGCADFSAARERLSDALARLKDWPQLRNYHNANAKLGAPAEGESRVVFLGDSITDFWSGAAFGGFFPGKPYVNRGISGQTTPQMLVRFRADVIDLRPKAVVILAGTNDIAGNTGPMTLTQTESNVMTMAELASVHGIRVVLASVLPVNNYGRDGDGKPIIQTDRRPIPDILNLNAWIKSYAEQNGHIYLDYFSSMVDNEGMLKKEFSGDGLHPNAKGYLVMAPLADRAIQEALRKR
jgi:lysophospholipase L1-like esterase